MVLCLGDGFGAAVSVLRSMSATKNEVPVPFAVAQLSALHVKYQCDSTDIQPLTLGLGNAGAQYKHDCWSTGCRIGEGRRDIGVGGKQ